MAVSALSILLSDLVDMDTGWHGPLNCGYGYLGQGLLLDTLKGVHFSVAIPSKC